MTLAAILFGVTALGGIGLFILRLQGMARPPLWLALGHGTVAVASFVALGVAWMQTGLPLLAQAAFVAFLFAALGGATLLIFYHLRERELPIGLIAGHALVALVGLGLLVASLIQTYAPPAPIPSVQGPPPHVTV